MRTPGISTPTRATTVARAAVVVVVAIVAATAVWLGTSDHDQSSTQSSAGQRAAATRTSGGVSEQVAPSSVAEAPASGVVVPGGSTQVDGYPAGFPYTDLGAVAVQLELAKAQIGFDYSQAAKVAALYADPAAGDVFAQRARDAVSLRREQAGIASEGQVPAPASYAVTPIAYTLEQLDTDYYAVNLLSYVTLTTIDGESRDNLYAGTQLVRWVPSITQAKSAQAGSGSRSGDTRGGDWKVTSGSGTDIEKLSAEGQPRAAAPGTPAFAEAGWIPLDLTGGATTGDGDR